MKIAISNIAWDRSEDAAVANLVQQYGVTGLDVSPSRLSDSPLTISDDDITTYVNFWQTYGVQIVGMQSLLYQQPELTLFGSAETRRKMREHLQAMIRLAEKLGVGPIVFGSAKNRLIGDMTYHTASDIAAEFFVELADYAHQHHTIFCLEPVPAPYGCDFVNTMDEALALVRRVNHPGFRVVLDSAAMMMNGEDIEKTLDNAFEWTVHFHISEPQLGVIHPGSETDHARFATHLRKLGYDHWVTIEMRSGWSQPDAATIETALAFVTRCYA